jgi:hypothetical protein
MPKRVSERGEGQGKGRRKKEKGRRKKEEVEREGLFCLLPSDFFL